jgi:endonuclease/exonuclease/phosphatase (EEP) superfamily protein YafD
MTGALSDLAGWALLLSSLLAFGGRLGFPIELFGHWRMQIAAAGLAAVLIAIGLHHAFLFGTGVSAVVNTVPVLLTARRAARRSAPVAEPSLTILWQNVWLRRAPVERLAAYAGEVGADVVALCETPLDLSDDALERLFPDHPHLARCQPPDPGTYDARIAVLSRRPIVSLATEEDEAFRRKPYAVLRVEGCDMPVALIHAASSAWPGGLSKRDAAIEHLVRRLAGEPRWIAIGDFNTTAWVPAFEPLRAFRLAPPFFRRTWRAPPPVYGLPLDHALASPGVAADLRYGPWGGSDHRPLVLRVG